MVYIGQEANRGSSFPKHFLLRIGLIYFLDVCIYSKLTWWRITSLQTQAFFQSSLHSSDVRKYVCARRLTDTWLRLFC